MAGLFRKKVAPDTEAFLRCLKREEMPSLMEYECSWCLRQTGAEPDSESQRVLTSGTIVFGVTNAVGAFNQQLVQAIGQAGRKHRWILSSQ